KPPTPADPPATPRDRHLEAMGGLTVAHLYQSYLNIGLLADATENDVYTEAEAKKMLARVVALMDKVDEQLGATSETLSEPDNQKTLAQVRQLTTLLRLQAKELVAYWDTPEKDAAAKKGHTTKYFKAR